MAGGQHYRSQDSKILSFSNVAVIGTEWAPVIIDSEEEFNIARNLRQDLKICTESPLVGGSINVPIVHNYYETPELYFPNNSGKCKNTVSMQIVVT